MKKIKILALIVAAVMLLMTSCSLFGGVDSEGDVTVVVENTDGGYDVFSVDLEKVENKSEGAKGVLQYLSERKSDKLYVEMTDGIYGAYVSAIGNIKESFTDNAYVIVYTSVDTDSYEGAPTVDYKGVTLYQSGFGISDMKVDSGSVILFRLEVYAY